MKRLAAFAVLTAAALWCFNVPAAAADEPSVSARASIVVEAGSGRTLHENNAGERLAMASTTKIMTALITLEQPDLTEPFVVDSQSILVEGSSMGLTQGTEVDLYTLAAGMLLPSGNDAANAAAVRIAGSVPAFVKMMNERARQLGLADTSYETPSGLDGENHYTTAADMAALVRTALQNEYFAYLCAQQRMELCYGAPPYDRSLENHNRLLAEYEGCIGVKTGYTKKAGRCLVSAARREGVTLICVTLCDPNDWEDHKALLDYGFSRVASVSNGDGVCSLAVVGGEKELLAVRGDEKVSVCVGAERAPLVEKTVLLPRFVYAPVAAGDRVGEIVYTLEGEEVGRLPLLAEETVEGAVLPEPEEEEKEAPAGFWGWVLDILTSLLP